LAEEADRLLVDSFHQDLKGESILVLLLPEGETLNNSKDPDSLAEITGRMRWL
jgi:hypothetical protein